MDDFRPYFSGGHQLPHFFSAPKQGTNLQEGSSLCTEWPQPRRGSRFQLGSPPLLPDPDSLTPCSKWRPGSFVFLQITKASRRRLTVSLAYSESHQIRVSQQDFRLFRTLFLLMISFFIMWSPIIITILLILIQNFKQDLVIWPSLFFWVVAFTFANSALNPILYNMSLFRNEWRKMFRRYFFPEKGAMFTDTSLRRNDLSIICS